MTTEITYFGRHSLHENDKIEPESPGELLAQLQRDRLAEIGVDFGRYLIASHQKRAQVTGQIITGIKHVAHVLPSLFFTKNDPFEEGVQLAYAGPADKSREGLGNDTLNNFYAYDPSVQPALDGWAKRTYSRVRRVRTSLGNPRTLSIFGHGTMSQALIKYYVQTILKSTNLIVQEYGNADGNVHIDDFVLREACVVKVSHTVAGTTLMHYPAPTLPEEA